MQSLSEINASHEIDFDRCQMENYYVYITHILQYAVKLSTRTHQIECLNCILCAPICTLILKCTSDDNTHAMSGHFYESFCDKQFNITGLRSQEIATQ